jgi:septum formation protein
VLASGSPRRARLLRDLGLLARAKAEAVAGAVSLPVLAADTEVLCDGEVLGKPASAAHAEAMLARLSGRAHDVVTGVCEAAERAGYVSTGEPMDKAGGYHVDGRGGRFVASIEGSPSNVAGLPLALVVRLLRECGADVGLPPGPA